MEGAPEGTFSPQPWNENMLETLQDCEEESNLCHDRPGSNGG